MRRSNLVMVITKKYGGGAISAIDTTVAVIVLKEDWRGSEDGNCNGLLSTHISFCKFEMCARRKEKKKYVITVGHTNV
jgi:hypothetical protein